MARRLPPGITVRKLDDDSERFDVRYRLSNGTHRKKSFRGVTAAKEFLASTMVDKARGGLVDPQRGRLTLSTYGTDWLDMRADLGPTTLQTYRSEFRLHIEPGLGGFALGKVDRELVRRWRNDLIKAELGASTVAKCYRLLHAIFNTAVEDGRILANPCQIKNAGAESPVERPTVSPTVIRSLAAEVPAERSCMVLLAGFCGLRLGEVLGLALRHVDLLHGTVKIERQLQEIAPKNTQQFNDPKSEASRRTLPLPGLVADALRSHIEKMEDAGPDALLFTGARGGPLRRHVWHGEWDKARKKLGYPGLRYHDLRHSSLTLYATSGATIAEIQAQAGHSTVDAALRYQHATRDRAVDLAALVDTAIRADQPGHTAPIHLMREAEG